MIEKSNKLMNVRVFAILSVIIYHSIILYSDSWDLYLSSNHSIFLAGICKLLNFYMMPLFFSLSGFLFFYSYKKRKLSALMSNKFLRLLIPFVFVGTCYMIPIRILLKYPGYNNKSIGIIIKELFTISNAGHLWYLPALFVIFILTKIILSACDYNGILSKNKDIILLLFGTILYFEGYRICFKIPSLLSGCAYLQFFSLGFLLNQREEIIEKYLNSTFPKSLITIVALLLMIFCSFAPNSSVMINLFSKMIFILTVYLVMPSKTVRMIQIIDRDSFGMYLFHSPLTYITYTFLVDAIPSIVVGINLLLFGCFSILLTEIIRRTRLNFIIGECSIKKEA